MTNATNKFLFSPVYSVCHPTEKFMTTSVAKPHTLFLVTAA